MSDLTDLYQEVILDHNRRPRNYGLLEQANRRAHGHNPLCGDRVTLQVRVEDPYIADIRFEASGCAISRASASLMTDAVKGKSLEEASELFSRFQGMVTTPLEREVDEAGLGKLVVPAGVRAFPVRIKCASLPWHALRAALAGTDETTTE
jgi:nitrogen fixation NifU-like protein